MDYGQVPPEVHSARMHSGPGAESLLAAGTAWSNVADGLDEAADGFRRVTAKLNCGWQGTAAIAMTQAATPTWGGSTPLQRKAGRPPSTRGRPRPPIRKPTPRWCPRR